MDTSVIATTEDLQVEMLIGIIGKIWVTAVYSDPDGESPPSNSVENTDLPIGIDENQSSEGISFFYDPAGQSLHFSDPEQLSHINIINLQGITVKNSKHLSSDYSLTDLTPGCYFVKVYKNDGSYLLKKIIR